MEMEEFDDKEAIVIPNSWLKLFLSKAGWSTKY